MRESTRKIVVRGAVALALGLAAIPAVTQDPEQLTVKELMQQIIVPTTAAIWGAYDIKEEAQWQELAAATDAIIRAGAAIRHGGAAATDQAIAANADWQQFTDQMITAAQNARDAIIKRDEEALSNVGNDQLYPPCESCHAVYMAQ